MSKARGLIKLTLLVIFTLSTYTIFFIGLIIPKLFKQTYEPWRNLFMRTWSEGVAFIFNIIVQIEGKPPKAPFFLVSNHLSYLDIVPLYKSLRGTFVAKKAVQSWPVLGFMVDSVGVIFVDRNRRADVKRVNELLSQSMNEYQGLILFPEGTSSGGEEVLPFHASLLQYPADNEILVHVAAISYETADSDLHARDSVCFFGRRDGFLEHLMKLAQTTKVDCVIRFGEKTAVSNDRKALAEQLHQNVKEIFSPTSSPGEITE